MKCRKKLIETVKNPRYNGIFFSLFSKEYFEWLDAESVKNFNLEYYLNHSGDKKISKIYDNLLKSSISYHRVVTADNSPVLVNDNYVAIDVNQNISKASLSALADIIIQHYGDKWNREFDLLVETNYNPIHNYDMKEKIVRDLANSEHKEVNTSQTSTNTQTDSTYGYNSSEAAPTDKAVQSGSVTGDAKDNYHDIEGTDTGSIETERAGNIGVTTTQRMMLAELELRDLHNFANIIYKDIDKILCMSIY